MTELERYQYIQQVKQIAKQEHHILKIEEYYPVFDKIYVAKPKQTSAKIFYCKEENIIGTTCKTCGITIYHSWKNIYRLWNFFKENNDVPNCADCQRRINRQTYNQNKKLYYEIINKNKTDHPLYNKALEFYKKDSQKMKSIRSVKEDYYNIVKNQDISNKLYEKALKCVNGCYNGLIKGQEKQKEYYKIVNEEDINNVEYDKALNFVNRRKEIINKMIENREVLYQIIKDEDIENPLYNIALKAYNGFINGCKIGKEVQNELIKIYLSGDTDNELYKQAKEFYLKQTNPLNKHHENIKMHFEIYRSNDTSNPDYDKAKRYYEFVKENIDKCHKEQKRLINIYKSNDTSNPDYDKAKVFYNKLKESGFIFDREEFYSQHINLINFQSVEEMLNEFDSLENIPGVIDVGYYDKNKWISLDVGQSVNLKEECLGYLRRLEGNKGLTDEEIEKENERYRYNRKKYRDMMKEVEGYKIEFILVARDVKDKEEREKIEAQRAHDVKSMFWSPGPGQEI